MMRIPECHQREVHCIAHIVLRNKCHSRKLKKLTRLRMPTSLWRMYIRRRNKRFFDMKTMWLVFHMVLTTNSSRAAKTVRRNTAHSSLNELIWRMFEHLYHYPCSWLHDKHHCASGRCGRILTCGRYTFARFFNLPKVLGCVMGYRSIKVMFLKTPLKFALTLL